MNGISLKELRWFSTFNDEFLESESLSIWQAVLFMLPYFDDEASVSFFNDLQRMESEVYEDLIIRLNKKGQPLFKNDTSPNYAHSYTEWDDMGNLLLSEEQIDEILPELNHGRMLVTKRNKEAHIIYKELILEIMKSRDNRIANIHLVEDKLRDDFERVLIARESLSFIRPAKQISKKEKALTWNNIVITISYLDECSGRNFGSSEDDGRYLVFKARQRILCEGTPVELRCKGTLIDSPFKDQKENKSNRLFLVLRNFGETSLQQELNKRIFKIYRKDITELRKFLKSITGIPTDPFETKLFGQSYQPHFTVEL
ncbi:MAG: hypothetical protein ACJAS1_005464 [Oleiphilaceae bacterium]|jgi:hypothetical protein